jgi:hypothetical protein
VPVAIALELSGDEWQSPMAKYANGKSYRPGNDNLNEHQFTQPPQAEPFSKANAPKSRLHRPTTEVRSVSQQRPGEKGGKWKRKGRQGKNGLKSK